MLHSSPFTRFRVLSEINLSGSKSQIGHRLEKIYAMSVFFEKIATKYQSKQEENSISGTLYCLTSNL
jgi:hypothetical protein